MAYVQRFGLSRTSPLAAFGEPSKAKTEEKTPANDVIKKENKKSSDSYSFLDGVTDALTVAGMVPGFGIIPDAANTILNLGRAGVSALTGGDTGKYLGNASLAGLAMIPGVGQGVSGTKLAAKVIPKAVDTVQALDKGSKVMKLGKVAKKIKTAKGAGIAAKPLLGATSYETAMANKPKKNPALYM